MGSREQGIILVITTAGFNTGGPCYMLRNDVLQVLSGNIKDTQRFGIIYTLDEGDDWPSPVRAAQGQP